MLPERTDEQRREALRKAVDVRKTRAAIKRAVKDGAVSLAAALEADAAQGMHVYDILRAVPGFGKAKARGLMAEAGIAPCRRVRALKPEQKKELSRKVEQ